MMEITGASVRATGSLLRSSASHLNSGLLQKYILEPSPWDDTRTLPSAAFSTSRSKADERLAHPRLLRVRRGR
jgi:hypothetical protein